MRRAAAGSVIPLTLLLLFFTGYVLYPLAVMVGESLAAPDGVSFHRYAEVLNPANRGNVEAAVNSVMVSILSVVGGGLVGVGLAFTVTQLRFPLRRVIALLAVVPVALPPLVGVIAFLFVFGESGILPRLLQAAFGIPASRLALDGLSAIVAVHVYSFNTYFFLFASAALRRIDASQLEAAAGLGASPFRIFRLIVLPELRPALAGASVLTFMASMASFSAPLLFAGSHRFITLQIYTTKLNGDLPLAATQSLLLSLVAFGFFLLLYAGGGSRITLRRTRGAERAGVLAVGAPVRALLVGGSFLVIILEALPLAVILMVSFAREGSWTWQILPESFTVANYTRLLGERQVFEPILNSLLMAAVALAAVLLVGVTAAYLVTKGALRRRRGLWDALLTLPYAIPGTVLAIALILSFNRPVPVTGFRVLVGTFWILPLAYLLRTYPLMIRSASAALDQLDDGLLEAAASLGAGPWLRFRTVILPLILPAVVGGGVLTLITVLGEFVSSILLYTFSTRPIAVEILAQLRAYNFGSAAAYCVLLMTLILLVVGIGNRLSRPSSD
ncbi:MAG TPA: iron ABC transporter permease [Bacteroidota bacterium]